ncbi:cystatin [Ictalurus punctatus]|uniref:Cystatin n=1 Tax=Ictalurus punctatus TaxID=7998 RepID=A0A2D0QQ40_ICTPU|nr:cystatin [Ictalurus punctatus]
MFVKVAALLAVFLAVASAQISGAPADADIKNPEVKAALRFAVAQYNNQSNSIYLCKVVKVIKAQVQVVSGSKYYFTVVMAQTSCKKEEAKIKCAINSDPAIAQPHECNLVVWSQPWLHRMVLTENTC